MHVAPAAQVGYWVGKVESCVDKYSNYWIKIKGEDKFYRPVEEVFEWQLVSTAAALAAAPAEAKPAAAPAVVAAV